MNFFRNIFNKDKDDSNSLIPPQSRKIKGIKPIVIYAVEILFTNSEYKNEIFENLLKGGKKHGTKNILVFIYYCTYRINKKSGEYEKRFVSEEQAKNELLKYLSLDRSDVYYFVRDLADYLGTTDMEWITKIKNRKRELLEDGTF